MPTINFTQFLRPNGRQRTELVDVSIEVATKAKEITAAGLFLEAEILITGMVSLTIADRQDEVDLAIELVPNGPDTIAAVERLIRNFNLTEYKEQTHDTCA